jgi:hypothetical protein
MQRLASSQKEVAELVSEEAGAEQPKGAEQAALVLLHSSASIFSWECMRYPPRFRT